MPWTTREHWLWGLVIPGRFHFLSIMLGLLVVFSSLPWKWPITILFGLIGIAGIPEIEFRWRSFSLSILPFAKMLIERNGIVMVAERQINLGMAGSITFAQTWMGQILDYGTLTIGAMGGPYQWENLGNFRTMRRIIESQGEWMPRPRRTLLNVFAEWGRHVIRFIVRFLLNIQQILSGLMVESHIIVEHLRSPNYQRFLEFAESLLFSQNLPIPEDRIQTERVHGSVFSTKEIRIYQRILRARRLIVFDARGRAQRHKRIRTPNDIRRHVPIQWFRRVIRAA